MSNSVRHIEVLRGEQAVKQSHAAGASLDRIEPTTASYLQDPARHHESMQQVGFEKGYNDGLEAARVAVQQATDDANRRVRHAIAALNEAVSAFDARQTVAVADIEDVIVSSALALASSILQRELRMSQNPGAEAIARAMKLCPDAERVIVRMNPHDVQTLATDSMEVGTHQIVLVADANVQQGGCILEAGLTTVDAQISSALASAREALFNSRVPTAIENAHASTEPHESIEQARHDTRSSEFVSSTASDYAPTSSATNEDVATEAPVARRSRLAPSAAEGISPKRSRMANPEAPSK